MKFTFARLRHELTQPVLFDEGIEAARNACAGGASIASAAITAAAFYDSPLVGIRALRECMDLLQLLPLEIDAWLDTFHLRQDPTTRETIFAPGFGYVDPQQAAFLVSACRRHSSRRSGQLKAARCSFYLKHKERLLGTCGPLNRIGLMALVSSDHGVTVEDAERNFLLWQLDSAIREAQRARREGLGKFPFLSEYHQYEGIWPDKHQHRDEEYLIQIGLEEKRTRTPA